MNSQNLYLRKFPTNSFLGAAALILIPLSLSASPIAWSTAHNITGDADVSTTGTLVQASNIGPVGVPSTTVHGVTFAPFEMNGGTVTSGVFTLSSAEQNIGYSGYGSANPPFASLTGSYQDLLNNGNYGADNSEMDLTISGLTPGQEYQFQFWVNDSRAIYGTQPLTATDGALSVSTLGDTSGMEGGTGQYALLSFTADSNGTEIIKFQGDPGSGTTEEAFQLRDIGHPSPTPTPSPTPPPHGGLSQTIFTVDGSFDPTPNVADTILRFAAYQSGKPAGLSVREQSSTTPAVEGSWTDLPNGNRGGMTFEPSSQFFITATLNYPTVTGLYFRALASAHGYTPDSISNQVGPFNLASSKPRLSPPEIAVTGNGPFADLYFRSYVATPISGMALRVQSSTTPEDQTSWVDLNDGKAGHMLPSNVSNRFYLMDNKLPTVTGVYYRILASLSGHTDALSPAFGPLNLTLDTPPTVTVTPPKAISGSGTQASPYIYNLGSLGFVAKATAPAGGKVAGIGMTADSELFAVSLTSTVTGSYTPASIGDHVVEAIAVDSKGGIGRFGTSPTYIRVIPRATTQESERADGSHSSANATVGGKAFTLVKANGSWTDATAWKDSQGKSGVPGANDFAIIPANVYLPTATTVHAVSISGGQITGGTLNSGANVALTVTGTLTDNGGTQATIHSLNNIHLILDGGATCTLSNTSLPIVWERSSVENYGTITVHGGEGIQSLTAFNNFGTTNFAIPLAVPPDAGVDPTQDTRLIGTATPPTNGGLLKTDFIPTLLGGGSSIINQDGGSLINQDGGSLINQDGGSLINQDGGSLMPQGGGNLAMQGSSSEFARPGEHAESVPSGFVQTGGETDLDGLIITGGMTLNGGILSGSGVIEGDLTNNGGYISPGHSAGVIGVTGSFTQGANGTLVMQDGGAAPDEFDQLQVAGKATLGGTLNLQLINGYKPSKLDTFSPLGYDSMSGKFATISSNAAVTLTSSGVNASVDPTLPGPVPAASRNISTRAFVQTGDNVAIAGFIVTGPAGSTKKVIIRGIGPSLSSAGVSGALADPNLQLFQGSSLISSNDNWKTNAAPVIASGLAPTNDLESAIVATLAPGAYTAILSGTNQGTGVGLIEVYDLSADSPSLLANISTRCSVQTGDNVLIGGFILQGDEPSKILVRALGPSLTKAGVTGALADPILDLFDSNGDVLENDDWQNTQEADITSAGLAPTNSKESVILATLPPGAYTAIVMGKNGGTGVALVEVYNIQ